MFRKVTFAVLIVFIGHASPVHAQEADQTNPVPQAPAAIASEGDETDGKAPETKAPEELTPEAADAAAMLRETLPNESEALAMLDSIIEGSRLGPGEGWFKSMESQSRFGWEMAKGRYDTDNNDSIDTNEFLGAGDDFSRLDRDGSGTITPTDFDWSQHSLAPTPGAMLFFMSDRDGNGKVTAEEFTALFGDLGGDEQGFLALDDLRQRFEMSSSGGNENRPDRPSRSTLILGLKNQEIGSLQPGPNLGDTAPDFSLQALSGETVTLSEEIGEKPIVLIFGNFTCGPFRSQAGNIEKLYEKYKGRAKFYLVYVREAHPAESWWMMSNKQVGIEVSQPVSDDQRRAVAQTCQQRLDLEIPFLVDTVEDRVGGVYSGMPNRLYLIDTAGKVAFKNARGPFGFHPRQLEQALVLALNESE
jgi:thiol-disulfide isomerase/thioredoxin